MKISKLKKLKNNYYELSIFHDDKNEVFKISEDYIIQHKLYNNKEITEKEYLEIKMLANKSKIYNKTLNYLSYKMRTEYEVRTYLEKNNCVEPIITEIINKLKRLNYLNDQVYSELYVKQQFDINKKGPILIKKNLIAKQIDKNIIETSLKYIDNKKINNNISHLIYYYDKLNKKKSINQLRETIMRNLVSKGYSYDDIIYNLNNYEFSSKNDENDILKVELLKAHKKYLKKYNGYELKNRIIKVLLRKGFIYEDILNMFNLLDIEL